MSPQDLGENHILGSFQYVSLSGQAEDVIKVLADRFLSVHLRDVLESGSQKDNPNF